MKYFPIHILIKDLSFWITFFLMVKFINHDDYFFETDFWTIREILGTSIYMTMGFSIIGIILFSEIYLMLKRNKQTIKSFWFGVGLHLITILLIWINVELDGRMTSFLFASIVSLTISGIVYQKLNAEIGIENQIKKCIGV
jgi:hypothetical protein